MAVVIRVYGRNIKDRVVVISDDNKRTSFYDISEFDVANILRAGGVGVRVDAEIPESLFNRLYGKGG